MARVESLLLDQAEFLGLLAVLAHLLLHESVEFRAGEVEGLQAALRAQGHREVVDA